MIDRGMLWAATLEDMGRRCSVDTTLDIEYVQGRIAAEGESFLTNSLPQFGKDFELALADLSVAPNLFVGFKRRKRTVHVPAVYTTQGVSSITRESRTFKHGIPQFLQGFMEKVFDDSYDVLEDELHALEEIVRANNHRATMQIVASGVGTWHSIDERIVPLHRPVSDDRESMLEVADAVNAIRQLCLMFGKEKSMCSDSNVERAISEFVSTDKELIDPFSTEE